MHSTNYSPEIQFSGNDCNWHALYTRHQHEKHIARLLSKTGHEVFLPTYNTTRKSRERTKHLCLPLFPCYVFIRGGLDRRIQILTTPGVFAIVTWGGKPAIVPAEQIAVVRKMVEGSFPVEPYPYLECGDRVRVASGALRGLDGILIRKKNQFRLIISFEMLGRSAAVEIDISCLETPGPVRLPMPSHPLANCG
jgi:transcription antitermination factor NusG